MHRDVRRCKGLITAWLLRTWREMVVTEWLRGSFQMGAEQNEGNTGDEWGRVRIRSVYLGHGCAVLLGEGRSRQHLQRGLPGLAAAAAAMTLSAQEGKENITLRPVSHRKAILAEHRGAWPYKNHKSAASTPSFKIMVRKLECIICLQTCLCHLLNLVESSHINLATGCSIWCKLICAINIHGGWKNKTLWNTSKATATRLKYWAYWLTGATLNIIKSVWGL